jgi:biopolymer transport protein ExbD
MRFKKKSEEDFMISVTPLVDIVLVCLIFFMITYHFDIVSGARINLPKVINKNMEEETNRITIIISKSAEIYIGGEKFDQKSLEKELQSLVKEKGILSVILQADKDVSHGNVVEIMDIAKSAGIDSIIIAARWKAEGLQ